MMKFLSALTLIFLAANIFNFIDWHWVLVLIPFMIQCSIWLIAFIAVVVSEVNKDKKEWWK